MSIIIDRHRAFRALLLALAMPGRRQPLPLDCDATLLLDAIYGDRPDAVLAQGTLSADQIASAQRGTEIVPEAAALIFVLVDTETQWTRVRLSGPGIRQPFEAEAPLSSAALIARNAACVDFPRGIDLVAIDDDEIIGYPRTTRMEAIA